MSSPRTLHNEQNGELQDIDDLHQCYVIGGPSGRPLVFMKNVCSYLLRQFCFFFCPPSRDPKHFPVDPKSCDVCKVPFHSDVAVKELERRVSKLALLKQGSIFSIASRPGVYEGANATGLPRSG